MAELQLEEILDPGLPALACEIAELPVCSRRERQRLGAYEPTIMQLLCQFVPCHLIT